MSKRNTHRRIEVREIYGNFVLTDLSNERWQIEIEGGLQALAIGRYLLTGETAGDPQEVTVVWGYGCIDDEGTEEPR